MLKKPIEWTMSNKAYILFWTLTVSIGIGIGFHCFEDVPQIVTTEPIVYSPTTESQRYKILQIENDSIREENERLINALEKIDEDHPLLPAHQR